MVLRRTSAMCLVCVCGFRVVEVGSRLPTAVACSRNGDVAVGLFEVRIRRGGEDWRPAQQTGPPSLNTLPATFHPNILKKEQVLQVPASVVGTTVRQRPTLLPSRSVAVSCTALAGAADQGPCNYRQRSCPVTPWLDDDVCRVQTGIENEAKKIRIPFAWYTDIGGIHNSRISRASEQHRKTTVLQG